MRKKKETFYFSVKLPGWRGAGWVRAVIRQQTAIEQRHARPRA